MKSINTLACHMLVLCGASAALAAPLYNIVPLGFDDTEHTRNDGYRYTNAFALSNAGRIRGFSTRFNGGSTYLGWTAWLYDGTTTINIGLTGPEHTRNDSFKKSEALQLNEAGKARGYSERYNGGGTLMGYSGWLYNGATTIDISLDDNEHTRSDGYRSSGPSQLNEAGQVIGHSSRFNGNSDLGLTAWLYNGASMTNIGLVDAEHTRSDGYRYNVEQSLNEAGQVLGYSNRYSSDSGILSPMGVSAWLYDGATTMNIGLVGIEHTGSDGTKFSLPQNLNEAGQAIGSSNRYNGGSTYLGTSTWFFDGVATIDTSLLDAEHTRDDGFRSSLISGWNEAGQIIGFAARFNGGSTSLGSSAWLYDGATTIKIGLLGAEHTRNDGFKESHIASIPNNNEAGHVIGYSQRYNGGSITLGQSAWIYNGTTSIDIGLVDAEHTRNDGYKYSGAFQLNAVGHVIGSSNRYNGAASLLGYSAWLYIGASTTDIGLVSSEHTRNDGYKRSEALQLNLSAQVIGTSNRYNGGSTQLGQDAWFYDPAHDQTIPLQLSARSDGYAFSRADFLGEDGLVLGTYTLFDALDNNLGDRAFYFTVADGLHDLGSLVEGGLTANGWDYLASAIRANGLGQIVGHGKLTSQSGGQMAYLLTPTIPEPSALVLATSGVLGLFARRRARRSACA